MHLCVRVCFPEKKKVDLMDVFFFTCTVKR